jgi:HD-GYP domain-containing protein (c-di-GMP phosphodiesterase class II)
VTILQENSIERITFLEGLPKEDLVQLINDLASHETTALKSGEHIKLGRIEIRVDETRLPPDEALWDQSYENLKDILLLRDATLSEIKGIYRDIQNRKKQIDIRGVEEMINAFVKGFTQGINPISMLAALKSVDEYTFTHVINVCILTMSQAENLGFSGEHLYQIGVASVMHDAGKLFIPKEILNKPGKLSEKERAIIETHTTKGARYIIGLENIPRIAVLGALEHHIKYDGTGYPLIRNRWSPNLVSQMIAIADVFDALRSRRSYSVPKSTEQIIKILIEEKGSTFNPILVDHFIKLIKP